MASKKAVKLPEEIRKEVRAQVRAYFQEPDVWMERYIHYCFQRWLREGKLKLPRTRTRRKK
ncbi:MAG: hypothetical protein HY567_00565 [Candidatus Kerfeldbacteria bacterium]|nr:hypothetical protein [Candidatus Kerfeldbacteria bacterium]